MTKTYNTRVKVPTTTLSAVEASSMTMRTNDDVLSNPGGERGKSGRSMFDRDSNKAVSQPINCKDITNVSFQNVRTIREQHKRIEIANLFNTNKINIMGIADHKIVHSDENILTERLDNCTLITSSAWRNSNNAASGGVGLIVSKAVESALCNVETINERIICAHFNGNPTTSIVVHYSPTEGSVDAEEHYANLANVVNSLPKHNIILLIGDFNAHIGKTSAKHTYHETTNNNGKLLLELANETNMIITNTNFQKRRGKLWTFISDMSGAKSQIDYILVNHKWKNSVKNVEAYSSFSSIGSDHRVITARLKLSLRTCKTPAMRTPYDWEVLRGDSNLQQLYTVKVQNRYTELCTESANDATNTYQHLIKANEEAAKTYIPIKKRTKRKNTATDPRIVIPRQRVNDAFTRFELDPSNDNQEALQREKEALKSSYDRAREEELESMIKQVENADARAQHAQSWKLINQISGRKSTKKGVIKGNSKEDRINSWYQHFSQLLGTEPNVPDSSVNEDIPPIFENLNIESGAFTMDEYQEVKMKIRTGKLPGGDDIPSEVLKYCDLDTIVLKYANMLLIDGEKPQQWSDINLIPLPKAGDLGYTTNYRGIALSQVIAKMVNKMLLNRIQPTLDPHLRPNQNGFRPKRSTTAHILGLRRIIEGVTRNHLKAAILFVDFSKAFDSVHRGKMLKILKAYGIPVQIVTAIDKLYQGTRARVITPDGETDYFDILAGVLQGDTLAPYLFAIVVDYVMRKAISGREEELGFTIRPRRSRRNPSVNVTDLDFADDIALLSNEIHQAQELLKRVETEAAHVGLHVNAKKTQVMVFNQDEPSNITSIGGGKIKEVDNFKYLGGWMKSSDIDIKIRKALAWVACHKLRSVWSSSLKKAIKIRLFLCTVESVLLYNSSTWTLTKQSEKSLNGTYTRMLRMALNVSWKNHMTNQELYGDLPKVSEKIAARRLRLAGHCVRHQEEIASNLVLWEPAGGRVNRGRKPTDYIDVIKRDTGLNNIAEIKTAMQDRDVWKGFVKAVRSGDRHK